MIEPRTGWRERGRELWLQLPLLVLMVLLWGLLWGELSWLTLITGVLIAFVVLRTFYLPPAELTGRLNVWWALVFLAGFLGNVVAASFQVASRALDPRPIPKGAIVSVRLRSDSDIILTLTAITITLIPGSLALEADRTNSTLYFHALTAPDDESVERFRRQVMQVERQLILAVGPKADLERLQS